MAGQNQNGKKPALSSDWSGLSPHLIASFFAVKKVTAADRTVRWERDMSQPEVLAPLTDSNLELTMNWQSPFENMGPDQKFSSFSAMLQAGGFSALLEQLKASLPQSDTVDGAARWASEKEGKSNLTKLNSTQVFTGMPPVKFPVTLHFRAFSDANAEVEKPIDQLMRWAVPQKIAPDGLAVGLAAGTFELFASDVPQIIGMKYANKIIAPLVIESVTYPMSGPRSREGYLTHAALQMQIATLTALDRQDWEETDISRSRANFGY